MLRSTNLFTYPKLSRKQNKANIKCRLNAEMRIHHGSPVKNLPVIPHRFNPWVVRSPGEGNGNPLQFSYLGNPMGREAWQAIVNRFTRVRHALVTKPQPPNAKIIYQFTINYSFEDTFLTTSPGGKIPFCYH